MDQKIILLLVFRHEKETDKEDRLNNYKKTDRWWKQNIKKYINSLKLQYPTNDSLGKVNTDNNSQNCLKRHFIPWLRICVFTVQVRKL